jgi:hypothetical protein
MRRAVAAGGVDLSRRAVKPMQPPATKRQASVSTRSGSVRQQERPVHESGTRAALRPTRASRVIRPLSSTGARDARTARQRTTRRRERPVDKSGLLTTTRRRERPGPSKIATCRCRGTGLSRRSTGRSRRRPAAHVDGSLADVLRAPGSLCMRNSAKAASCARNRSFRTWALPNAYCATRVYSRTCSWASSRRASRLRSAGHDCPSDHSP